MGGGHAAPASVVARPHGWWRHARRHPPSRPHRPPGSATSVSGITFIVRTYRAAALVSSLPVALSRRRSVAASVARTTVATAGLVPTSYAVAPAVAAAPRPCTCLTKEYTQDGLVVFQDLCTKEVASAPAGNTQSSSWCRRSSRLRSSSNHGATAQNRTPASAGVFRLRLTRCGTVAHQLSPPGDRRHNEEQPGQYGANTEHRAPDPGFPGC